MRQGRINVIAGCIVIFIATLGGFVLGGTLEPNFAGGFYKLEYSRSLMRTGHTHGMLFAYYNLIAGLLMDKLRLSDKEGKWLSYTAIGAFLTPLGVFSRGLLGGTEAVMPVVMIGGLCYLASTGLILKGAWQAKAE